MSGIANKAVAKIIVRLRMAVDPRFRAYSRNSSRLAKHCDGRPQSPSPPPCASHGTQATIAKPWHRRIRGRCPLDSCGRTNKIRTSRGGRAIRHTQSIYDTTGRLAARLLPLGAVTAGSAGTTAAKDLRYPESGPVAFQLHLPDIWTAKVGNSGSMLVIGPDGSAAISLTLMHENEVTLAKTPDELANTLFFAAKAEPFNKHEKGVIGGVPADSYYSRLVRATSGPQVMKINMIKSLHGYIVLETILTAPPSIASSKRRWPQRSRASG